MGGADWLKGSRGGLCSNTVVGMRLRTRARPNILLSVCCTLLPARVCLDLWKRKMRRWWWLMRMPRRNNDTAIGFRMCVDNYRIIAPICKLRHQVGRCVLNTVVSLRTKTSTLGEKWREGRGGRGRLEGKWHRWWISFFSGGKEGRKGKRAERTMFHFGKSAIGIGRERKRSLCTQTRLHGRRIYCIPALQWDRCTVNHLQFSDNVDNNGSFIISCLVASSNECLNSVVWSILNRLLLSRARALLAAARAPYQSPVTRVSGEPSRCARRHVQRSSMIKSNFVVFRLCALDVYTFADHCLSWRPLHHGKEGSSQSENL